MKRCVYSITNMITDEIYIGGTKDFSHRKSTHLYDLRHQRHLNPKLQAAYNQHGEQAFVFDIIETIESKDKDHLKNREQHYIDTLHPSYNLSPNAFSQKGRKHSLESKQKMSESAKKRSVHGHTGKTHTPESRQKMSEKRRTQPISENQKKALAATKYLPRTEEWRRKLSESNKKTKSKKLPKNT